MSPLSNNLNNKSEQNSNEKVKNNDVIVYVTNTGKKYHTEYCSYGYTPMKL